MREMEPLPSHVPSWSSLLDRAAFDLRYLAERSGYGPAYDYVLSGWPAVWMAVGAVLGWCWLHYPVLAWLAWLWASFLPFLVFISPVLWIVAGITLGGLIVSRVGDLF